MKIERFCWGKFVLCFSCKSWFKYNIWMKKCISELVYLKLLVTISENVSISCKFNENRTFSRAVKEHSFDFRITSLHRKYLKHHSVDFLVVSFIVHLASVLHQPIKWEKQLLLVYLSRQNVINYLVVNVFHWSFVPGYYVIIIAMVNYQNTTRPKTVKKVFNCLIMYNLSSICVWQMCKWITHTYQGIEASFWFFNCSIIQM